MSELQSRLNALVAWAQEELGGRRRVLACLERQERAVLASRVDELETATAALGLEIELQGERAARRRRLFGAFAGAWRIPVGALSLASIAERVGPAAAGLAAVRVELREAAALVLKKNRRITALLRAHRRVVEDVIRVLVDGAVPDEGTARMSAGHLVDAEG